MQWNRCNVEKYCDYTFLYYINNLIYFSMILLKVSHYEIQILVVVYIFLSMYEDYYSGILEIALPF